MEVKVYELKKGTKILYEGEIIIFEEIRGERAIFYNEWGEEFEFPDFFYVDEIGEIKDSISYEKSEDYPTLF